MFDAHRCSGFRAAKLAMEEAIRLADEFGVGVVSVDNAFHYLWGAGKRRQCARCEERVQGRIRAEGGGRREIDGRWGGCQHRCPLYRGAAALCKYCSREAALVLPHPPPVLSPILTAFYRPRCAGYVMEAAERGYIAFTTCTGAIPEVVPFKGVVRGCAFTLARQRCR